MNSFSSFLKARLLVSASFILVGSSTAPPIEAACARTPALALHAVQSSANEDMLSQGDGYRIVSVRWDPLLNQRWAMVASCEHPERPSIAMLLTGRRLPAEVPAHGSNANGRQSPFPVIHAGDVVQLRSQERNLRIEVAGRAEENGAVGSKVRVRLLHSGFDAGQEQTFIGTVRGPGYVELEP
jgi:hypothetical protein